jgi:hypothetical protein
VIQWLLIKRYALQAFAWVHENLTWILLTLLGVAFGRELLKRKDSQVSTLKDALAVQKHKVAIEALRVRKEEVDKEVAASEQRDVNLGLKQFGLERTIAEHKREILALHTQDPAVEDLDDEELARRFRDAGL